MGLVSLASTVCTMRGILENCLQRVVRAKTLNSMTLSVEPSYLSARGPRENRSIERDVINFNGTLQILADHKSRQCKR